jgi:hypothetical protein
VPAPVGLSGKSAGLRRPLRTATSTSVAGGDVGGAPPLAGLYRKFSLSSSGAKTSALTAVSTSTPSSSSGVLRLGLSRRHLKSTQRVGASETGVLPSKRKSVLLDLSRFAARSAAASGENSMPP